MRLSGNGRQRWRRSALASTCKAAQPRVVIPPWMDQAKYDILNIRKKKVFKKESFNSQTAKQNLLSSENGMSRQTCTNFRSDVGFRPVTQMGLLLGGPKRYAELGFPVAGAVKNRRCKHFSNPCHCHFSHFGGGKSSSCTHRITGRTCRSIIFDSKGRHLTSSIR